MNPMFSDLFTQRHSSRAVDPDRPVDPMAIVRLFEAARWAPSSANRQPWNYIVFDAGDQTARDMARGWLMAGNAWALNAPVLVLATADLGSSEQPNRFAMYDVGAATVSAALQAAEEGLLFHQMGGYDPDRARRDLKLPDHIEPAAMIAIGHPGSIDQLPEEKDRARESAPRQRRPIEEFVHGSGFEGPWLGLPSAS